MDTAIPFQACKRLPRRMCKARASKRHMRPKRRLLACICTALLALPPALVADERVTLAFAWPAGLHAKVHYSAKKTNLSDTYVRRQGLRGSYTLQTRPSPDGLGVHFDHVEVHPERITGGATEVRLKHFMAELANAMPSYLVNDAGAYLRLVGMERFQRNIRLAIEHFLSDVPGAERNNILRVADFLSSDRQLEANMAANWNQVVGVWAGVTLEQGRLYQAPRTDVVPALANVEVPVAAEFVYRGKVPCRPEETRRVCVQLDMQSSIDAERLRSALKALVRQLQQRHSAAVQLDRLEMNSTVRLVTEPETLLPHRLESSKTTLVKGWLGAQPLAATQIEETEVRYEYRRE